MLSTFNALFPIFSLIILGFLFQLRQFPSTHFWENADKLVFYVLIPAFLIKRLGFSKEVGLDATDIIIIAVVAIIIVSMILVVFQALFKWHGASFSSIYQGATRFNAYVGLSIIGAMYGEAGLTSASALMGGMIPTINILCIGILNFYAQGKISFKSFILPMCTNPLILATTLGLSIGYFNIPVYLPIQKVIGLLGQAALPLGLISVGFGLCWKIHTAKLAYAIYSCVFKFGVLPITAILIGIWWQISPREMELLALYLCLPTAISSYIFARQLGGDTELMSTVITVQTALGFVMIPLLFQILPIIYTIRF